MARKALITGITGQDGSYLAELLLERGYEVHGIVRRVALEDQEHRLHRIAPILDRVQLHAASLESYPSLFSVFARIDFDECYHLAAQSFVAESFQDGFSTMNVNVNGTHYMLAALRELRPNCRFYFASSSEMFGKVQAVPQNERTPFYPRSPYGVSKVAGFHLTRNYRESFELYCCSGILFNHESPRRGHEFVTRKISATAARIKRGLATELKLGNLDARRDWGHAREYVEAIHLMLQRDEPEDLVIATGTTYSVRDACDVAFSELGLDYQNYVKVDPRFYRPAEVDLLVGDATCAREALGWSASLSMPDVMREMVRADLALLDAS